MPVSTATKVASILVANLTTDSMYCDHFIANLYSDSACTALVLSQTSAVVGTGSSGSTAVTNPTTALTTGSWTQVSKLANGSGDSGNGHQAGADSTSGLAVVAGLGLSVPGGATINGVVVYIMAGSESSSIPGDVSAFLVNDTYGVTPLGSTLSESVGYHYSRYKLGSSGNVWGAALTPTIVNASTFGIALTSTGEQTWSYNVCVQVFYSVASVPTPGHWVQQGVMTFDGLVYGTTYYLKAGVVAPVSGDTTWSASYSIVAGSGGTGGSSVNPTPACTYTVTYDVITTGVSYTVTPATVPTDIDHFDYYYQFGSSTAPGSGVPARGSVPYSPDLMSTFHFSVACVAGAVVYVWIRAVSTSQATQAWTALTTKTSIAFSGTMDDIPNGSTYAKVSASALSAGQIASLQGAPVATGGTAGQTLTLVAGTWTPTTPTPPPTPPSVFVASGSSHATGLVPDPGASAGTTHYLREDATWVVPPAGFVSPMTTAGDIIYENGTPAAARLPIGSTGQVLTVAAGIPSWAAPSGGGGGTVAAHTSRRWGIVTDCDRAGTISAMGEKAVFMGGAVSTNIPTTTTGAATGMQNSTANWAGGYCGTLVYCHPCNLSMLAICRIESLTDMRMFIMLSNLVGQTQPGSDTPTSLIFAGFRFSTTAGDTNYQCCNCNGTTMNTVDSGVAADLKTHQFAIEFVDATPAIKFYIDSVLVATATTHLPASGTTLAYQCGSSSATPGGSKTFDFEQVQTWSDR